jgi:hypothetical protein
LLFVSSSLLCKASLPQLWFVVTAALLLSPLEAVSRYSPAELAVEGSIPAVLLRRPAVVAEVGSSPVEWSGKVKHISKRPGYVQLELLFCLSTSLVGRSVDLWP